MTLKAYRIMVATMIALLTAPVYAGVMRIDGTVASFELNSTAKSDPFFNPFAQIFFQLPPGSPSPTPCCLATKFDNITVGPFTTTLGDLILPPPHTGTTVFSRVDSKYYMAYPADERGEPFFSKVVMEDPTHVAFFFFADMTALVPFIPGIPCSLSGVCNQLIIQGAESIAPPPLGNNTSFDFSQLKFFSINLFADPGVDFSSVIENGGDITVTNSTSNSFVESAFDTILISVQLVPEPSSLSIILFGVAALWFARRSATNPAS
jgi:hypothetical protein